MLAYGYDLQPSTGQVALYIYDPNHPLTQPNDEEVTLSFNEREYEGRRIFHSRDGESVRGFFANRYREAAIPPLGGDGEGVFR